MPKKIKAKYHLLLIIALLIISLGCKPPEPPQPENIPPPPQTQKKEVIWQENSLVQPLPDHASKIRLSLPVGLEDILLGPQYHFQGFGAHIGDRSEGVEVVALAIREGTIIKNLADGKVINVIPGNEYMGCQVQIDYGDGLSGRHHYLKECLVKKGEEIKKGHPLGEGNALEGAMPCIEFLLKDENRTDGARSEFGEGSAVSMFDYLNPEDQAAFIALYEEKIIKPFIAQGKNAGEITLWEPFLTNEVLVHKENEGKLTGEWLLQDQWAQDRKPDIISFLDVEHQYFQGTHMRAIDAYDYNTILSGTWEVDYEKNQVKISGEQGIFYGIFEIDEPRDLATLKIEYQTGGYPVGFSSQANLYVERTPVNMYDQAREMGSI